MGVSLLSVAMISINRYILIAWPELYNKVYTKVKVCIYIGSIWLIAYGVQLPTLAGVWGVFGIDENLGTCSINRDKNGNTPKISLFVIGFALPCIVIIVSYAKIYCVVRKSNKRMESHVSITKKSEMHITKMVLVIFFCFVICYLPLTLVKVFDEKVRVPPLHVIGYLLLYLAACINPIVYVTLNKRYRRAYFNTLTCKFSNNIDSSTPIQNSKSMSVMFAKHILTQPKV